MTHDSMIYCFLRRL